MLVEIIVTNIEEAILAEQYGADRLELIHDFALGGLSPQPDIAKNVCNKVKIPVNVMLRPHGNNFIYDKNDIKRIKYELSFLKDSTQANGIVFGALDQYNNIDTKLLEDIISNKGNLDLTFHRAIDETANIISSYQSLLGYSEIKTILTSGGKPTALEGAETIKTMVEIGKSANHCQILAGSGITPDNANQIISLTKVQQIHLGTGVRTNNKLDESKFKALFLNIR